MTASPHALPQGSRPIDYHSRERAQRDAQRHSVRVRQLRKILPALVVMLGAGFIGSIFLDSRTALTSKGDVADLGVSGASITMENPKLTGFNRASRSYEILATRAEQSIADPTKITLSDLNAQIETESSGMARLTATQGRFDTQEQQLTLERNVTIRSDKGDLADLENASVDLKGGNIRSDQPVHILIGGTQLNANTMQVMQNGNHIIFDGKVRMVMQPRQGEPIAEPPQDMLNIVPETTEPAPLSSQTSPEGTPE